MSSFDDLVDGMPVLLFHFSVMVMQVFPWVSVFLFSQHYLHFFSDEINQKPMHAHRLTRYVVAPW